MKQHSLPVVAIHGGAGALSQAEMNSPLEKRFRDSLSGILTAVLDALERGGSALDAVTEAVALLEDNELFNAGRGSVLTERGTFELDAAVMAGHTLAAGAVAGVSGLRNPVRAARWLLEDGQHVMMSGSTVDGFFLAQGLESADNDHFLTPFRREQWERSVLSHAPPSLDHDTLGQPPIDEALKLGTVGAVALDRDGRLAAATSTGGMVAKRCGRIGDTPVIGAGCYADAHVAVSATGTGEAFIRLCAGRTIAARVEFGGEDVTAASRAFVLDALPSIGGRGGVIVLSRTGAVCMPFNTEGMYRGYMKSGERPRTGIYAEEGL